MQKNAKLSYNQIVPQNYNQQEFRKRETESERETDPIIKSLVLVVELWSFRV